MCTAMEIVNGCECVSVWYTDSKYVRRDGMEDEESLETEFHLLSHVLHYYRCVVIFPCTAARVRNMPNIHRFSECIIKWPLFICMARKFDCSLEYLSNVNRFFTCINCVHRRSFTFYPVFFSLPRMNILSIQVKLEIPNTFKQWYASIIYFSIIRRYQNNSNFDRK